MEPLATSKSEGRQWKPCGIASNDGRRFSSTTRPCISLWTKLGLFLSVNPFAAEHLGYSVNESVGRSVLNVFPETGRAAIQRNATSCLEQLGQSMSWEARKVRKDGTVLWVRETGKAILMKERPVILIVCEDITECKRL